MNDVTGGHRAPGGKSKFHVDVFWSMRSPFCYLALDRLLEMERNFEVFIVFSFNWRFCCNIVYSAIILLYYIIILL